MGETRKSLAIIFVPAKWFGIFPLSEKNEKWIFSWKSLRTLYIICLLFIAGFQCGYDIYTKRTHYVFMMMQVGLIMKKIGFIMFARLWPGVEKHLNKTDYWMRYYAFPKHLKKKLQFIFGISFSLTVIEFLMFDTFIVLEVTSRDQSKISYQKLIRILNRVLCPPLLASLQESIIRVIIFKVIQFQLFLLIYHTDISIIATSLTLAARFRQVAKRIKRLIQNDIQDEKIWEKTREVYQRNHELCYKLDEAMSFMILASISTGMFVILTQIRNMLSHYDTVAAYTYFTFVLVTTSLRCFFICYFGGSVYSEATKSADYLTTTPSKIFNCEIERLINQIRQDPPMLTAKQLFAVKHSLILKVLAAIASHELILLK